MLWVGIGAGFLVCFIFERLGEVISKAAGRKCRYDCDRCGAHCAGYHCFKMRQMLAEDAMKGEDTIEGDVDELSDIYGPDKDRNAL